MRKLTTFLTVLLAVILAAAFTTPMFAQQVFGSIYGTVTDASGAAVANAKVTITNVNKGNKTEVTTDANGNYNKAQLIPDTYKLTIEAAGFSRVASDNIQVHVDEAARFDAALKVGEVTTEVEVLAVAPLLQSDRADIAQTFSAKEINDLPEHRPQSAVHDVVGTRLGEVRLATCLGRESAEQHPNGGGRSALLANGL